MIKKIFLLLIITFFINEIHLYADEIRYLNIGMLKSWFSSRGCEIETGRRDLSSDQQDGFAYPALYKWQDMQAAKGLWIGTTNYADPLSEENYDYKVVHIGPREIDESREIMPKTFKLIGKFDHPDVTVNGWQASALDTSDILDEIDPQLSADRMILNEINTSVGITITRKIYAFSNPQHDNYFIYDFVFENTGIYDLDGSHHSLTLTDVIFYFQYRWAMSKYTGVWGYRWSPQPSAWGYNTVNEILHPNYGDEYNATYSWHGLLSAYAGDNIGAPNTGNGILEADGFLGAPQFPGVVTLHADKSASDNSNDSLQFTSAPFYYSNHPITYQNNQFDANKMKSEYQIMNQGLPEKTHAEKLAYSHNPRWQDAPFNNTKNAEDLQSWYSGFSQGIGYGPYTLEPGANIRIVFAETVGSINWQKREEVGENWYLRESPYILPDSSYTDDRDKYKDAWVFTGRDSLFQSFDRAIKAWDNGLSVDPTPSPPDSFAVIPSGDRIILSWSANAEDYPHFAGYKIYRQCDNPNTSFNMIYKCGAGTDNPILNNYEDFAVLPGKDYYYYIVSYDDGSVNTSKPGSSISSNLFWTRTCEPACLLRAPESDLKKIRLVPNPFVLLDESSMQLQNGDRLMFYNLPPKCDINLYTERGDFITTIHHENYSGEDSWNVCEETGKFVCSGIYIALIKVTENYTIDGELRLKEGDSIIKKFMIIR